MMIFVAGLVAAVCMLAAFVARTIGADGYGTRPAPRSHLEEVGPWVAQQLER